MSKEEIVQIMLDGFIEDMQFMYTNAGLSQEETDSHIEQGKFSFSYICNNTYDRLVNKSIIKE